jgi:hypothetical protein
MRLLKRIFDEKISVRLLYFNFSEDSKHLQQRVQIFVGIFGKSLSGIFETEDLPFA